MTDEELIKALSKGIADVGHQQEAADRIEDLTAQLKASNEIGKALEEDAGQLRADNARLRAALQVYAEGWDDDGRLARSTLNTGKEVMPSEPNGPTETAHDIGPGDQDAVAGAAQKEPSHE